MSNDVFPPPSDPGRPPLPAAPASGATLTAAEYDELVRELESRRGSHRVDLARRLRDARAAGSAGDGDEWHAVLEDLTVDQLRIAQLERLVTCAIVVDDAAARDGGARLGARVRVQDQTGETIEYELVGTRRMHAGAHSVSLASPVGEALLGARPGDVVSAKLPGGRERILCVLDVNPDGGGMPDDGDVRSAEAA